jgi:hypothetical protein
MTRRNPNRDPNRKPFRNPLRAAIKVARAEGDNHVARILRGAQKEAYRDLHRLTNAKKDAKVEGDEERT